MIESNKNKRIDVIEINSYLYKFKNKIKFQNEFNFKNGILLGKGTFGIVKKCFSKIHKKYYAVK